MMAALLSERDRIAIPAQAVLLAITETFRWVSGSRVPRGESSGILQFPFGVNRSRSFAAGPDGKSALARNRPDSDVQSGGTFFSPSVTEPRSMTMQDQVNSPPTTKRAAWNKGKLTGAKPPLRLKHVWSIRTKLQIEGRARDLAMFNLAIDSKLRGCDVVAIRVEDVAAGGYTADRATIRQKKTGRPVRFELSEQRPARRRPSTYSSIIRADPIGRFRNSEIDAFG